MQRHSDLGGGCASPTATSLKLTPMGRRRTTKEHIWTLYVTEEQRSRRPIFIPTLRAGRILPAALSLIQPKYAPALLSQSQIWCTSGACLASSVAQAMEDKCDAVASILPTHGKQRAPMPSQKAGTTLRKKYGRIGCPGTTLIVFKIQTLPTDDPRSHRPS
jgi:hypothetical protein